MKKILSSLIALFLLLSLFSCGAGGEKKTDATTEPTTEPPTQEELLRLLVGGKKLSILGDSISTYQGHSNSTKTNNTLGKNLVWFNSDKMRVADTWWHQIVTDADMSILVNNSWSASTVTDKRASALGADSCGFNTRPLNLHDNTLNNNPDGKPINPDIIVVYMGTNDISDGVSCNTSFGDSLFERVESEGFVPASGASFEESFALMIYKITVAYPDADIFCFNNPLMKGGNVTNRTKYNTAMKKIADHYGCALVDLCGSELSDFETYTADGTHPTAEGMDIMTDVFAKALIDYYQNKK